MLQAYMDESGIHRDAPACLFGGFVAVEKRWRIFERKWKKYLSEQGVVDELGRPDFHAKSFYDKSRNYDKKSVFYNWTNARRANFEYDLVQIIVGASLIPVAAGIDPVEFHSFPINDRRLLTGGELKGKKWIKSGKPEAPYFLLFQDCLLKAARRSRSKVHFILDQQKQYEPWAKELYHYLRIESDEKKRFGDQVFSGRQEALGIQAADLLLYQLYAYRREIAELSPYGIKAAGRPSLAMMINKYRPNLRWWTKSALGEVVIRHKSRKGIAK